MEWKKYLSLAVLVGRDKAREVFAAAGNQIDEIFRVVCLRAVQIRVTRFLRRFSYLIEILLFLKWLIK